MSGFITAAGADFLMGVVTGVVPAPENLYVALVTEPVGTSEDGSELTEPTGASYYRATIYTGPENWFVAYGSSTNLAEVSFDVAQEDWEGIRGWAVCDEFEGGQVLWAGDDDPYDVPSGDQVILSPGAITFGIALDGWRETQ